MRSRCWPSWRCYNDCKRKIIIDDKCRLSFELDFPQSKPRMLFQNRPPPLCSSVFNLWPFYIRVKSAPLYSHWGSVQAVRPLGGSGGMALLFHDHGTRRGWVQEAGWAPGPVWTGAENLAPTRIRSPDRLARGQSLYRLRYPAHFTSVWYIIINVTYTTHLQMWLHHTKLISFSASAQFVFLNTFWILVHTTERLLEWSTEQSQCPCSHRWTRTETQAINGI
jgi:hypothetical protein